MTGHWDRQGTPNRYCANDKMYFEDKIILTFFCSANQSLLRDNSSSNKVQLFVRVLVLIILGNFGRKTTIEGSV